MSGLLRTRSPITPALRDIQAPIKERLDQAALDLQRIAVADFPMLEEIGSYLLLMRGKMFRPTLTLGHVLSGLAANGLLGPPELGVRLV